LRPLLRRAGDVDGRRRLLERVVPRHPRRAFGAAEGRRLLGGPDLQPLRDGDGVPDPPGAQQLPADLAEMTASHRSTQVRRATQARRASEGRLNAPVGVTPPSLARRACMEPAAQLLAAFLLCAAPTLASTAEPAFVAHRADGTDVRGA